MEEFGDGAAGLLGEVVPASEADSVLGVGEGFEGGDFGGGHGSALESEGAERFGGEGRLVHGIDGAEVALGRDVEEDGLGDFGTEEGSEFASGQMFMMAVLGFLSGEGFGRFEEVADIVEEGGDDEVVGRGLGFGEGGGLKSVFQLSDLLTAVEGMSFGLEQVEEGIRTGDPSHQRNPRVPPGARRARCGSIRADGADRSLSRGRRMSLWVSIIGPAQGLSRKKPARRIGGGRGVFAGVSWKERGREGKPSGLGNRSGRWRGSLKVEPDEAVIGGGGARLHASEAGEGVGLLGPEDAGGEGFEGAGGEDVVDAEVSWVAVGEVGGVGVWWSFVVEVGFRLESSGLGRALAAGYDRGIDEGVFEELIDGGRDACSIGGIAVEIAEDDEVAGRGAGGEGLTIGDEVSGAGRPRDVIGPEADLVMIAFAVAVLGSIEDRGLGWLARMCQVAPGRVMGRSQWLLEESRRTARAWGAYQGEPSGFAGRRAPGMADQRKSRKERTAARSMGKRE